MRAAAAPEAARGGGGAQDDAPRGRRAPRGAQALANPAELGAATGARAAVGRRGAAATAAAEAGLARTLSRQEAAEWRELPAPRLISAKRTLLTEAPAPGASMPKQAAQQALQEQLDPVRAHKLWSDRTAAGCKRPPPPASWPPAPLGGSRALRHAGTRHVARRRAAAPSAAGLLLGAVGQTRASGPANVSRRSEEKGWTLNSAPAKGCFPSAFRGVPEQLHAQFHAGDATCTTARKARNSLPSHLLREQLLALIAQRGVVLQHRRLEPVVAIGQQDANAEPRQ